MVRTAIVVASLLAAFQASPVLGQVQDSNFEMRTAGDLAALCGVTANDPKAEEAIHFCHGYVVGITQYNNLMGKVFEGKMYCIDEKKRPTRNESIAQFVAWQKANPQYAKDFPMDGVLRWLNNAYPCKS